VADISLVGAEHLLPKTLLDLVPLLGITAVEKLVSAYGGRHVYVPLPESLSDEHELVALLGWADARRLAGHCRGHRGGAWLKFPLARTARKRLRDAVIVHRHFVEKISVRDLVREYALDERQIYNILASVPLAAMAGVSPVRRDERQGDLFS
jgi:Mor family transcriptional regulator